MSQGAAVQAQRQHRLPAVRAVPAHDRVRTTSRSGLQAKKVAKAEIAKRVDELLEVVRLGDFATRKPAQLSGGQQQRVALARALVNYPSALLLDEPLGALDLKLRQAMQLELKRIQREVGITFVFVTHDQEEALTMSDRIAVMSEGRVEQIGTPEEIYHEPGVGVRRRLHRHGQPAAGHGRTGATATSRSPRLAGDRRRRRAGGRRARRRVEAATLMVRPERVHLRVDEPTAGSRRRAGRRSSTSSSRARWCAFGARGARRQRRSSPTSVPRTTSRCCGPGDRVWVVLGARGRAPAAPGGPRRCRPGGPRDRGAEARRARGATHEQP